MAVGPANAPGVMDRVRERVDRSIISIAGLERADSAFYTLYTYEQIHILIYLIFVSYIQDFGDGDADFDAFFLAAAAQGRG